MKSSKNASVNLPILILISISFLTSCGLPLYEALDPPTVTNLGSGVNSVAFNTDNDELIDGYVIYYKIYAADETLIRTEEKLFDPTTYENDDLNELPSGNSLPKSLGFSRMGYIGRSTIFEPQISIRGGGHLILIDFTNSSPQTLNNDPRLFIDGNDVSLDPDYGTPAREVLYSDADFGDYRTVNEFKRYVRNYEFENSENYVDKDLQQMLSRNTVTPSSIEIAFVAYSYGISNTTLEPLSSIPIYLGTVRQNTFQNNIGNTPNQ